MKRFVNDLTIAVLASLLALILSAPVLTLFTVLAGGDPSRGPWLEWVIIVGILAFFAAYLLWRWYPARWRLLVLSQRRLAYGAVILSGVIAVATMLTIIVLRARSEGIDIRRIPAYLWVWAGVVLLGLVLIGSLALALAFPMRLSPEYCELVFNAVDQQLDYGVYVYGRQETIADIRRQARVLDVMARRDRSGMPIQVEVRGKGLRHTLRQAQPYPASANRLDLFADWAERLWQAGKSKGYWRNPRKKEALTVPRRSSPAKYERFFGNQLDRLFNGGKGFRVYRGEDPQFVTLVIKGPPGAGKSTLALQMCSTMARHGDIAVYYSLEEEKQGLLRSARDFGWDHPIPAADNDGVAYAGIRHTDVPGARSLLRDRSGKTGVVLVSSLGGRTMTLDERKKQLRKAWSGAGGTSEIPQVVRCVVIDSLGGFANAGVAQTGQFSVPRNEIMALKEFFRPRCDMLVLLVEDEESGTPRFVDFVADVVIQLGRKIEQDYMLLYVEILKARNQSHALGPSIMKLRSIADFRRAGNAVKLRLQALKPGILVYPSIHYRVFLAQHNPVFTGRVLSYGIPGLDEMISHTAGLGGVTRQDAIALLGPPGTGKSVIAMNFLIEGVRENTRTLLLALRDNADAVRTRVVHQDRYGMRLLWRQDGDQWYHHMEWDIAGVVHWWQQREEIRALYEKLAIEGMRARNHRLALEDIRLPYLFREAPVAYSDRTDHILAQAHETTQFLEAVAREFNQRVGAIEPDGDAFDAVTMNRYQELRDSFERACSSLDPHLDGALLKVQDRRTGEVRNKRIELLPHGTEDNGHHPCLAWDSIYCVSKRDETRSETALETRYDTSLLRILYWRPGNITPEEFFDILLRELDPETVSEDAYALDDDPLELLSPRRETAFERVVFDDISQLRHRFPLLEKSNLFLPALIDLFKAEGITSMFLADTPNPADLEANHGIALISDHVIRTGIESWHVGADAGKNREAITVGFQARPESVEGPRELVMSKLTDPPPWTVSLEPR